jgi:hypothetical protein
MVTIALILAVVGSGWWIWASGDGSEIVPAANRVPAEKKIAIDRIVRRVERLRGLRFRHPVKIKFATRKEAASLIQAEADREYSRRDRLIDEEELKLVGLLAPSVNVDRVISTIAEDEIIGFYDTKTKQLVVTRSEGDSRALQETTLAHELDHALEDQRFGIEQPKGFNDDRAAAIQALFEGTATALEIDYAARYLNLDDIAALVDDAAGADVKLPRYVERGLLFPYEQGAQFVDAFRERGNWRAIDQVLRLRHPLSTEQIIHPELYAIDERPAHVDVSDLTRRLGSQWHRVDSTTLGEFDLDSLFALVGKTNGKKAASGWDGAKLELWRRGAPPGCKAPCVQADAAFLRVAWDTSRDRSEAEKAFTHVIERGLKGNRIAGRRVRVWSSRGGAIGLAASGRTTTVVFVPDRSLATKLLG